MRLAPCSLELQQQHGEIYFHYLSLFFVNAMLSLSITVYVCL